MARGIRLTWAVSRYKFGQHDGIRVRFDASDACEMATKIFAYRMLPLNPTTGEKVGHLSHVCSPPDLEEFPEDESLELHQPEWFRLAFLDVLVRSITEAEDFIAAIRADVRRLKVTLDTMDTLVPGSGEEIGTVCPPASSSESSTSSAPSSESSGPSESLGPVHTLVAVGTSEQSISIGVAWTDAGAGAGSSLESSPAAYSQVLLAPGLVSQLLLIQGFDFSDLPDDAQIVGLSLAMAVRHLEADDVVDYCPVIRYLSLHHPDQGVIENRAEDQCVPGPDYAELIEGDDVDLWGETWTAALLKRGEFGVAFVVGLAVAASVETALATIQVDGAELTVHYR